MTYTVQQVHQFCSADGKQSMVDGDAVFETSKTVRIVGGVTETPDYTTIVSSDGRWVSVVQSEFRPVFGVAAWPMTWHRADCVARSLVPGARLVNQTMSNGFPARWSRTYRLAD